MVDERALVILFPPLHCWSPGRTAGAPCFGRRIVHWPRSAKVVVAAAAISGPTDSSGSHEWFFSYLSYQKSISLGLSSNMRPLTATNATPKRDLSRIVVVGESGAPRFVFQIGSNDPDLDISPLWSACDAS